MLLAELATQLLPSFKPSTQKDAKTAVLYLAKALDCSDPQHCPLELYNQPLPTLYRLVEDYLTKQGKTLTKKGKPSYTIRNTKNAISRLFRLAEQQQLFSLVPRPITARYIVKTKPHRPGSPGIPQNGTYLPYKDWPPDLQHAFTAFTTWAVDSMVPGRDALLRKRPVTVGNYCRQFEAYYGFLSHVQHLSPLTFEQLFDFDLVSAFVYWHVNELHHRSTPTIYQFLVNLLALTRQYRPDPHLRAQLVLLQKTLPKPSPVYNKQDAMVPMATLEEIGRALWPRTSPQKLRQDNPNPGLMSALHAGLSLMFQLWRYRPYRQRNMREMQLDENLLKDAQHKWRIIFRGEQLKVATKHGKSNVFDLPFPETLVPVLEEYLNVWRPILVRKAGHPSSYVFLTRDGTPFRAKSLRETTKNIVYRFTGKHWHPHIVRTVWATEWIHDGGDFLTVAKMLDDRLDTVIATYSHLLEEAAAEKADRRIKEGKGQGK